VTAPAGPPPASGALERLLATKEVVIACGPGGVGKTTTAASLAATAAARAAGRVLVVTVDPARRLADALGARAIGNEARRVGADAFRAAGVRPAGELWAAMLDTRESWDGLVRRHSPDAATTLRILENPLYQNIAGRFAESHEYIAMERLYEIRSEGRYDLVVVDTPPTRRALDLLDAPERMAEFFSSRLLRWLIVPYRSRLMNLAARPFYQVADRILGTQFLEDVAEFFMLFQTMYDGFAERAHAVSSLLREPSTTFMVVTTLEATPAAEAQRFVEALRRRRLHLGLLVANKVLPNSLADPAAARLAERLRSASLEVAEAVLATDVAATAPLLDAAQHDPAGLARVLEEVGESFLRFRHVARREAELLAELSKEHDVTARVPHLARDVTDLAGLLEIGDHLFGQEAAYRDAAAVGAERAGGHGPAAGGERADGPEQGEG
jgi:anion-transporting  ArsA/GET3 family ATPase